MAEQPKDEQILDWLAANGSDLNRNMIVDFHFLAPNETSADKCFDAFVDAGYVARTFKPDSHERYQADELYPDGQWLIECSINMVPTIGAIRNMRVRLDQLALNFETTPDGWGSYGNCFGSRGN